MTERMEPTNRLQHLRAMVERENEIHLAMKRAMEEGNEEGFWRLNEEFMELAKRVNAGLEWRDVPVEDGDA